jgi:hypothetical protein
MFKSKSLPTFVKGSLKTFLHKFIEDNADFIPDGLPSANNNFNKS